MGFWGFGVLGFWGFGVLGLRGSRGLGFRERFGAQNFGVAFVWKDVLEGAFCFRVGCVTGVFGRGLRVSIFLCWGGGGLGLGLGAFERLCLLRTALRAPQGLL